MLIAVLILNMLLALLCWWAIWQVRRLQPTLAEAAERLSWAASQAERLQDVPETLMQQRLQALRNQYRQSLLGIRRGQQFLSLLGLVRLWGQDQAQRRDPLQVKRKARKQS